MLRSNQDPMRGWQRMRRLGCLLGAHILMIKDEGVGLACRATHDNN